MAKKRDDRSIGEYGLLLLFGDGKISLESLIEKEERASPQQLQEQFQAFLGNQGALQSLYACLCSGISKRQDLARKLKVTTPEVKNRLSRLRRRAAAFLQQDRSERIKKGVKKVALQIPHLEALAKAA